MRIAFFAWSGRVPQRHNARSVVVCTPSDKRKGTRQRARRGMTLGVNTSLECNEEDPLVPAVRVVGFAAAQAYFLAFPALPAAVVP